MNWDVSNRRFKAHREKVAAPAPKPPSPGMRVSYVASEGVTQDSVTRKAAATRHTNKRGITLPRVSILEDDHDQDS